MSLVPRSIAVQGVGFGVMAVATLGFITAAQSQARPLPQQGAGPSVTSRYSDDRAYDPDRVRERLAKVVIRGKEYDPFDPRLIDILEAAAATPEPDTDTEMQRQERKLSRQFVVRTADRDIEVPMFRPMLGEMPNFKDAFAKDFEKYAEKAAAAAEDEKRRIMLILLAADF